MVVKMFVFLCLFVTKLTFSQTPATNRFDCYPDKDASESSCESRGCIWDACDQSQTPNCPFCYYPNDWGYIQSSNTIDTNNGWTTTLSQSSYKSPYGSDITSIKVDCYYETNNRIHLRYTDPNNPNRYSVPIELPPIPSNSASNPTYIVSTVSDPIFGINIFRSEGKTLLLNGSLPGFMYSDQFIQITFGLPSNYVYGWGERYARFLLPTNFTTLPSFTRDIGDWISYQNSYGVHPILFGVENNGNMYGITIINSNANELVLTPLPGIQYRTIGGILDIYIFMGPSYNEVVSQYWDLIGYPFLPAYWSLGFHLCRYCYNSVNRTRQIVEGMIANNIPYDTQWNDIDYMDAYYDFTYDPNAYGGLPNFVENELHNEYNMKYVHIIDPGIANDNNYNAYTDGVTDNAFILDSDGKILIGQVWPGTTAYPDFWAPQTPDWWYNQMKTWRSKVHFDGWWLDMNEPSNFVTGSTSGCPDNSFESPPYYPLSLDSSTLNEKTICMSALQYYNNSNGNTQHYNIHSLFGYSESKATSYALNKTFNNTKRNFILSRSTFIGSGKYTAHWLGDNNAHYGDMWISISGIINFNMFGIPMVGPDICGFNGDTTIELCSRWMAIGSFYPFSRNHNTCGAKPQDPPSLGEPVISISRKYLNIRYSLLPVLYTLYYKAHLNLDGSTVIRPILSSWRSSCISDGCLLIDKQFLWSDKILFSPVLVEGDTSVNAYFPDKNEIKGINERWFDYFTGNEISGNGWQTLQCELDCVPIHLRGGNIFVLQDPNNTLTTVLMRKQCYQLLIALDSNLQANGDVYIDDGISPDTLQNNNYVFITFNISINDNNDMFTLTNNIINNNYNLENNGKLNMITIYGLSSFNNVSYVNLTYGNNNNIPLDNNDFYFNITYGSLIMNNLPLTINDEFSIVIGVETAIKNIYMIDNHKTNKHKTENVNTLIKNINILKDSFSYQVKMNKKW